MLSRNFRLTNSTIVLAIVASLSCFLTYFVEAAPIVSGYRWKDTNGNYIQAHGGGIYKLNSTYYWIGEDKTDNSGSFQGFHLYSSSDLSTWKDEGLALSPSNKTTPVGERPKIIFNKKNQEYVLWYHAEDSNYSLAETGVATSKTITGPYTFQSAFQPLQMQSRDMSVYVDDDEQGYLIFATNDNLDLAIATMNADYTNVTEVVYTIKNQRYEGSGMFKKDGKYYLVVSHQSGWKPNDDVVMVADSPRGPFSEPTGIAPSGTLTYASQNNFDLVVEGQSSTTYMYMGDRWRDGKLGESSYIWQRFAFDSNSGLPTIEFADAWNLDAQSGNSNSYSTKQFTVGKNAITGTGVKVANCSSCPDGKIATYVGNSNDATVTFQGVQSPNNVAGDYWIGIYYVDGDAYPTYRNATVSANGGTTSLVECAPGGSTSGNLFSEPVQLSLKEGDNTITIGNPTGYAPDISDIVVYQSS
ncbi:hypothetical protein L7F22_019928 [Adiantum nelumboides]|nr:hypothetical protein [Adiantum nelumboides]